MAQGLLCLVDPPLPHTKTFGPTPFSPTGAGQDAGVWEVVQLMIAARLAAIVSLLVIVKMKSMLWSLHDQPSHLLPSTFLHVLNVCCG